MIWLKEHREQIKKENSHLNMCGIAKRGGELWRTMNDKTEWVKKSVESKDRYKSLMKVFRADQKLDKRPAK